jgi:hypothetical protein
VCRAPCRHVGPTLEPRPTRRCPAQRGAGWERGGCHCGPTLNVPADHAVRGWIGRRWEERTDGWGIGDVPSRGAASRCRGVGYDEVSSFVLELISCERTWFVRFHVGLPSKIYKQKLVLIIRLKLETKYLSC